MSNFYSLLGLLILIGTATTERNCVVEETNTLTCNYFPNNITEEISRVKVVDLVEPVDFIEINSTYFMEKGWMHVKYLEIGYFKTAEVHFTAEAFSSMKMLIELRINLERVDFNSDVFVGLNSVETLNVEDCYRLSLNDLLQTLNGTDKLKGLRRLTVSKLNYYHTPIIINESFGKILQQQQITHLDMSNTGIEEIYLDVFRYFKYLRYLNISHATIGKIILNKFNTSFFKDINFDLSHAILPHQFRPVGKLILSNVIFNTTTFRSEKIIFSQASTVNVSSIFSEPVDIWIKNCTIVMSLPIKVLIRRFIFRNNYIRYFDIKLVCNRSCTMPFLEELDVSNNGLQFVSAPSGQTFMPKLKILTLSSNQLSKMVKNNISAFEKLLNSYSQLQFISLSENGLSTIPLNLFSNNFALQTIDLSKNKLDQVTFALNHLTHLELLDLRMNNIHILSQESLGHLNAIPRPNSTNVSIMIINNPISCSKCEAKAFIHWLITSRQVKVYPEKLTCVTENGHHSKVNENTLQRVQDICNRPTKIAVSSVSGVVALAVVTCIVLLVIRYKKRTMRLRRRNRIVQLLENGENHYEFAAFLSYSSADADFVTENVLRQLNDHLQLKTGIERGLVCTGDQHLRPGFYVLNETRLCFERVSTIVIVVSNNFCNSSYCCNEFNLAFESGKPMLLMFKESVDEQNMPDVMRQIYRRKTRILWTFENGEYILRTKWDNIALSILDLIQLNK